MANKYMAIGYNLTGTIRRTVKGTKKFCEKSAAFWNGSTAYSKAVVVDANTGDSLVSKDFFTSFPSLK